MADDITCAELGLLPPSCPGSALFSNFDSHESQNELESFWMKLNSLAHQLQQMQTAEQDLVWHLDLITLFFD